MMRAAAAVGAVLCATAAYGQAPAPASPNATPDPQAAMSGPAIKDIAGPIATILAAAAAAFVAYRLGRSQVSVAKLQADVALRNWQTSNEKIVLELFERRIAIFDGIRTVVAEVIRTGRPTNETYFSYVKAIDRAPYFFGPEVIDYLEELRILIADLQLDSDVISDNLNPERAAHIKGRTDRMKKLVKFYETSKVLFGPYIQAHQKIAKA